MRPTLRHPAVAAVLVPSAFAMPVSADAQGLPGGKRTRAHHRHDRRHR